MGLRKTALVALFGSVCSAGPSYGQSLADVARREADRRQTVRDGGRVYTNKDLPNVPPPATSTAAGSLPETKPEKDADARQDATASTDATQNAAPKQDTGQKPDVGGKKESAKQMDQASWHKRMKDLRDQLDRDQTYVDALQSRVNALTTDFVNRDDPAQRAQVGIDRLKALTELDRLKKQIGDDKRAIADLEEEARRTGVPPGWLR